MMEAVISTSETSVKFNQAAQHNIPEDSHFQRWFSFSNVQTLKLSIKKQTLFVIKSQIMVLAAFLNSDQQSEAGMFVRQILPLLRTQ
jgi:hypothetical protein